MIFLQISKFVNSRIKARKTILKKVDFKELNSKKVNIKVE